MCGGFHKRWCFIVDCACTCFWNVPACYGCAYIPVYMLTPVCVLLLGPRSFTRLIVCNYLCARPSALMRPPAPKALCRSIPSASKSVCVCVRVCVMVGLKTLYGGGNISIVIASHQDNCLSSRTISPNHELLELVWHNCTHLPLTYDTLWRCLPHMRNGINLLWTFCRQNHKRDNEDKWEHSRIFEREYLRTFS